MKFILLKEESQDYILYIHTGDDKMLQMNIRSDTRQTPTDETQRPQWQSKYSEDDTDEDIYAWLDENDPRRYMKKKYLTVQ